MEASAFGREDLRGWILLSIGAFGDTGTCWAFWNHMLFYLLKNYCTLCCGWQLLLLAKLAQDHGVVC